jgi:hypothetical protein
MENYSDSDTSSKLEYDFGRCFTAVSCCELSQYKNGGALKIKRKPVQLVVLYTSSYGYGFR